MGEDTPKIDWIDMGDGWHRTSWVRQGYDCRTECKHTPKGDHGVSDDDWLYVVSNGVLALALSVTSGVYPPTVKRRDNDKPRAWDFEIHAPWPITCDDNVREIVRLGRPGTECDLVEGGRCYVSRTSMSAGEEWFKEHGTASFEQSGFFWDEFRRKAVELFRPILDQHEEDKHIVRCPCCNGAGVVDDRKEGTAR
jgi:hypothetical protein